MYYEKLDLLINGEFCQGSEGKTEAVINPATEEEIARVPHASRSDIERALNASCLLYTSPSPRDATLSRMPSSA